MNRNIEYIRNKNYKTKNKRFATAFSQNVTSYTLVTTLIDS